MKKSLILILVCVILTGCSKENNITINYYNNDKDKIVQKDIEEIKKYDNKDANLENYQNSETLNDTENINNAEEKNLDKNDSNIKDESKIDKIKDWYKNNKDELKDISDDIIKEDTNKIEHIIDNTTNWYNENKESLKESTDEIYNNDKDIFNDLYKKIKKANN